MNSTGEPSPAGERIDQKRGLVFLIQRYSIHDGPGIRTTVFLKGCPLRCPWCQNPESWDAHPELMSRDARCILCGRCVESCPHQALEIVSKQRKIDWARCTHCFECVPACPTGALDRVGQYLTGDEVMKEVEKDDVSYYRSGGGVTLSGGEPLLQEEFTHALLKTCKERGLHTALDTCGHARWSALERVLPYADLILYDLKHLDPKLHREQTGQSNSLILNNLRKIPPHQKVWLRIPLIPGFNDSPEFLKRAGVLAKKCKVGKVSLLPFHKIGEGKNRQIGKEYRCKGIKPGSRESIQRAREIIASFGVPVSIGE